MSIISRFQPGEEPRVFSTDLPRRDPSTNNTEVFFCLRSKRSEARILSGVPTFYNLSDSFDPKSSTDQFRFIRSEVARTLKIAIYGGWVLRWPLQLEGRPSFNACPNPGRLHRRDPS